MQEQVETTEQEPSGEAPQEEPQEEPDYKARTEELEALVDKLQNDQKSRDGQRRRETDRDAELAGFYRMTRDPGTDSAGEKRIGTQN